MTATETAAAGRAAGDALTADSISYRIDRLPFLPFHWRIAGILGTGTLFDAFDSLSISSALTMMVAFNLDYQTRASLISAAFAGQFIGAIAFGYVAEHIGRKWSFVVALMIFGVCSFAAALAQTVDQILAARVIQGVGLGAEVPIAAALFSEFLRGRTRGVAIAIYESAFAWGIYLAPIAALGCLTLFGQDIGWRALFLLGAIPALVSLLAAFKLPESPRWLASRNRLDEAQAIVKRMEDEARRLGRPSHPAQLAPVVRERTRFLELFQGIYAKRTFVVWTQWFCAYFVSNGYLTIAPTLYMKMGGLPAKDALLVQIAGGTVQLGLTYIFAFSLDRHGRKPWFVGGFLASAIAAAAAAIVLGPMGVRGWLPLACFSVAMTVGVSFNALGVYVYTPELYPTRMRAWATATSSSMNRAASFTGPLITGYILAHFANVAVVFAMMACVAAWAAFVMGAFGEETKRRMLEELSP
jgi:MFS transporter, putative metabolite:H+ symporter